MRARRDEVTLIELFRRGFDKEDTKLLFEVLFDIKRLIAEILDHLEGGDDDGERGTREEED